MKLKDMLKVWKIKSYIEKLIKSTTTQNVTLGAGAVVGIITVVRNFFPQLIFWPESMDTEIEVAILTLVIPLVSRVISWVRNPEKFD